MKLSLIILLLCIALIGALKMLGLLNASPILVFITAFGLAMILIFVGFIVFAKKHQQK